MRAPILSLALCLVALVGFPDLARADAGKVAPPPVGKAVVANPLFGTSGIADWKTPPAPTAEPAFKPPVPRRMRLKNGMALVVIENHALPIASLTLFVPGAGAASDPVGKGGLAAFTADLLDEGAAGLSAIAIAEEQDRLGASIRAGVDVDSAQVSVSTLTKTLDHTLGLFAKIVMQPAFDDKEAERVKGDRATSLELRRDRPREVVSIMLNAALYGRTTPYGHPASGTRDDFKGVTVADVRTFYQQRWNPAAMTLVVAGDVDARALRSKLDTHLGTWRVRGAKRPTRPVARPAKLGSRVLLVDRKGAAQSDVRVGLIGLARKDPRYFQFEVFRTALGDGFTSRLTQRLREQLGITYGAGASMDYRLARGPFVIGSAIVTPATAQGLSEIIKIVGDLAKTELPRAELDKAKQNMIRALPAQFDTNAATVRAFVELVHHGLPDSWYARYAAGVRRVTARHVKRIAKTLVPSNKLVFAIVGDLTKVRPELDKLGLGTPAMHDLYGMPVAAP